MLNRIFVVDSVTLSSTGTAVSSYVPWDQTTRKLPTQVVIKATGQGAYVRLSNDNSAATKVDVLVQGGDHVVLSVQGRRWVSVLSDGASSTVSVGALSTGVSGDAASLSLDFAGTGTLDPRVTFTRASTATYFNSAGVLTSAAIDAPRFDYNPSTLAAQGLLIEESRTNSIRNNTMVGAVAGTPGTLPTNWAVSGLGTLTREIVGTGTSNGITYVDIRFSGTTSTTQVGIRFEPANVIAAANGQTWAFSLWVARVGGSTSNIGDISANANLYDSGSLFLAGLVFTGYPTTVGTTLTRVSGAGTIATASTAFIQPQIYLNFASGVAIDITLRIGLPQLELGAFATSVIPTTTTALTRAADVASVNTLSPWFNAAEGTLFAESSLNYTVPGTFFPLAASLNDNSSNNRIEVGYLTTVVAGFEVSSGGVSQAGLYPVTAAQTRKTAGAYAANDFAVSTNGGTVATDTSGSIPSVTRLALGTRTSGGTVIHLRRVTYYPRRLSNAELQAITA